VECKSSKKPFFIKITFPFILLLFSLQSNWLKMNWTGYVITILLSTFTGWVTTWIAIKMLFHPRKPIKIFGFTIQGIFPKNQQLIAQKLGQVVSKELLSFDEIEKKITNPDNLQKLKPEIEAHIDNFLRNKLKDVFPMLSMLIGDKTINQLKEAFITELENLFPVLMKNYMHKLQNDLDLEKIVTEKIAGFSAEKLEDMLDQITKKEFKFLEFSGAFFGLIIGIIQVLFILITR
jgi:uncharacterized membrane protein YheB (UPF0754 family)